MPHDWGSLVFAHTHNGDSTSWRTGAGGCSDVRVDGRVDVRVDGRVDGRCGYGLFGSEP